MGSAALPKHASRIATHADHHLLVVLSYQAVSIARRMHPGVDNRTMPVPNGSASQMQSTPQLAAGRTSAAANTSNQAELPVTAAAEPLAPLHTPAQRLPGADGSRGGGGGGGGALSGFDKFLASLSQQTAAQHLQPHLQPAVREAYRSLDEQRHKLVNTFCSSQRGAGIQLVAVMPPISSKVRAVAPYC